MKYKLVICEKPSAARSISAVLKATEQKDGFFIGDDYIVAWCTGHMLELAAPNVYDEKYKKWQLSDLPIIPQEFKHIPSKGKSAQLKILKTLINRDDVDCVINACDAGREGENIARRVLEYAKNKKPLYRFWASSMEDSAIKVGFDGLANGEEYDNLAAAASCREFADWIVGINATRAFSCLYGETLNVGRVQSPTLALLVKREADIVAFVEVPFYVPYLAAKHDNGNGSATCFSALGEKFADEESAEAVVAACRDKKVTVHLVERKEKTLSPPKLFDLTELQREANRRFDFTAQETLDYAQSLYEKALISYPRTDSRFITSDMKDIVSELVELARKLPEYDKLEYTPNIDKIINNAKVSDHHAILPTNKGIHADISALHKGEGNILKLVVGRLPCSVAPIHRYDFTTIILKCGDHFFTAETKYLIEMGWGAIDVYSRDEGDPIDFSLPEFTIGQELKQDGVIVKEGTNTPPRHFTDSTLLGAMESAGATDLPKDAERRGLGTPATRANLLERLIKSGFVVRQKKNLIPTEKGKNLIAVLPDALTSPMLTAEWEHKLCQIQRGELSEAEFMNGISAFIKTIIAENNVPKPEYLSLFKSGKPRNETLGYCPRCGESVREGIRGFFCDTQTCGFKLWKDSKFWTTKKKPLTADIVTALLKDGRVALTGLHSENTGRKYDATIILDDTGEGFVNFLMKFTKGA